MAIRARRTRVELRTSPSSPVERLFTVLELAGESGAISVADVVYLLDIPRPTVHRLVNTLQELGYLQKMPGKGKYGAAPRLVNLAANILSSTIVYAPLQTTLAEVARKTGETCSLAILSSSEVEYIASAVGNSPLTLQFHAGQRAPLYCTSSGRIFLAGLSDSQLAAFLATGPWDPITPNTITEPKILRAKILHVRAQGFALNDSEYIVGVVGVAVPVASKDGRVLACLTVSAPKTRKTLDDLKTLVPMLKNSAARIARAI
jgi:DNA-binding IclR family transcriptional regulator